MAKKGPTVCEAVATNAISALPRRGLVATEHDVEAIAERVVVLGGLPVLRSDQPRPRLLVGDAVPDRIVREQWIAFEVHLRHQSRSNRRSKQGEMDVRRPPGIEMIAPGIGARLDRHESIMTIGIG